MMKVYQTSDLPPTPIQVYLCPERDGEDRLDQGMDQLLTRARLRPLLPSCRGRMALGTWQDGLADPRRLLSCWSHPGCCPDRALTPRWGDGSWAEGTDWAGGHLVGPPFSDGLLAFWVHDGCRRAVGAWPQQQGL